MDATFLSQKFDQSLPYDRYLATGTDEQRRRWPQFDRLVKLTDARALLIKSFTRDMKLLVVSGIWCGDCVQQVPLIRHIADANPRRIELRIVDRDAQPDLRDRLRINAGQRVPVAIFMAEDFELCSIYGERTLT